MIVIVSKIPKIQNMTRDDMVRLAEVGLGGQYIDSEEKHNSTLEKALHTLTKVGYDFTHIPIDLLEDNVDKIKECSFCITVGGDGTVLAAQKYLAQQPIIAINSDPTRSQGFLTPFRSFELGSDSLGLLNNLIRCAHAKKLLDISLRARLQIKSSRCHPIPFLNDVLYTNENPSVMSEYVIRCPGRNISEKQRSSGVWVSTPQGSTGAINSAGVHPIPVDSAHYLFKVREPYHGRSRLYELEGWFSGEDEFGLVSTTKGMKLYLDGSHTTYEPVIGEEVTISPYLPLSLVVGICDKL